MPIKGYRMSKFSLEIHKGNFLKLLIAENNTLSKKKEVLIYYLIKDILVHNEDAIPELLNGIFFSQNTNIFIKIIFNNPDSVICNIPEKYVNNFLKILSQNKYKDFFFVDSENFALAIANCPEYFEENLRQAPEKFILKLIKQNGRALQYISDEFKNNEEIVRIAINQNGNALKYANGKLQNKKKIVLAAVEQNGEAIKYASHKLKNNKQIALAAVKQNGSALKYVGHKFKNNKQIVLAIIEQNGRILKYGNHKLKNNEEIVRIAVKQNGDILQYASNTLKNNESIVLDAVAQSGRALKYVNHKLKNSERVALTAVTQNADALQYVSDQLKNNKKVVLTAVTQNADTLQYASDPLKNNEKIVLTAVMQNGEALQYASDALKNNEEIVLVAVYQNGCALQYANDILKNNEEIVFVAVNQNGCALQYASDVLKNNEKMVLAAVIQNSNTLHYANSTLKNNKNIILAAVKQQGSMLQYANDNLKKDKNIVLQAIKEDGTALQYVNAELQHDTEVVLTAVKNIAWEKLEKNHPTLNILNNILIKNKTLGLEIVKVAPSSISKLTLSNDYLEQITSILYSVIDEVKKIHLIWFGSLPKSYYTNIEEIVKNNPQHEITLWVNNAKVNPTLFVINKSIISEELINKIDIKSFDKFTHDIPSMLEDIDCDYQTTMLQACDLYKKYCYGIYHNYAGASDIARLILLAIFPGIYIDIDFACNNRKKEWSKFKQTLPMFSSDGPVYLLAWNNSPLNAFIYSKQPYAPFIIASLQAIINKNSNLKEYEACRYAANKYERRDATINLTAPDISPFARNKKNYSYNFIRNDIIHSFFSSDEKAIDPKDSRWREVPLKGHHPCEFEDLHLNISSFFVENSQQKPDYLTNRSNYEKKSIP